MNQFLGFFSIFFRNRLFLQPFVSPNGSMFGRMDTTQTRPRRRLKFDASRVVGNSIEFLSNGSLVSQTGRGFCAVSQRGGKKPLRTFLVLSESLLEKMELLIGKRWKILKVSPWKRTGKSFEESQYDVYGSKWLCLPFQLHEECNSRSAMQPHMRCLTCFNNCEPEQDHLLCLYSVDLLILIDLVGYSVAIL